MEVLQRHRVSLFAGALKLVLVVSAAVVSAAVVSAAISIPGLRQLDDVASHEGPFHVPDVRHNFALTLSDLAVRGSILPK